jgi:hypothetical protein
MTGRSKIPRYSDTDLRKEGSVVPDGPIFGMFKEWDPELMLLIEARKTDDGATWHYRVGRFNWTPGLFTV